MAAASAGLVLKEPDICFLLGGGRWIVEHGQIPSTDPFSYTTHYHWAPYVVEKWLTEVIFYLIYSKLGAVSLLIFDAIMLSLAFVVVPYRILYRSGWRGVSALGITFLSALVSCSHLALRPEIFSFVFTGIWLEVLLVVSERTRGNTKIDWRSITLLALLMSLWNNLHTLFLVGFLLPGMYCGCMLLEKLMPSLRKEPVNLTVPIMFMSCILASLLNPWGYGLWTYIPNIFGPFNDTNNEMQSIKLSTVANPFFYPYYIFILLGIGRLLQRREPLRQNDLFFRLLVPLGAFCGVKTIRSIPLADLFLVAGTAHTKMSCSKEKPFNKPSTVSGYLDQIAQPSKWPWIAQCLLAPALGAYLMTFAVPISIPQASKAFDPPFGGIEYITKNPPNGNLLNDPHFGACMIWNMHDNPKVFIDPRYNLFGNDLLQDYWKMVKCKDGWQERMTTTILSWVFLPLIWSFASNWLTIRSGGCYTPITRAKFLLVNPHLDRMQKAKHHERWLRAALAFLDRLLPNISSNKDMR